VLKPARYTGGETNQIEKDPARARARMALAFPDVYDIGMSHLGTKILYALLNRHDDIYAERAFCPWVDLEAELRERSLPILTLETASPLRDFDVVGFSFQYELTYTNVLNMLDLSGIPIRSADRTDRDPVIIAGGPCATQPEPMAPFVDAFLIGDAEEALVPALKEIAQLRRAGRPRRDVLLALARREGWYVPAFYETALDERSGFVVVDEPTEEGIPRNVKRQVVEDLKPYPFPDDAPVAAAEAIFDRMAIEIARGCTEGCRFCQAGMIYRPVRERDPDEIVDTIVRAMEKGGYDEIGLTTLSTADYSCISPLIKKVMAKLRPSRASLSVASLRAYGLDEDLFDEIRSVRATGLTFAPEAGTQRMRDVVNKNISEEDLSRTAHRVFQRGWRRMKLYFMIGLPTETDEDVDGIMETGRRMKAIGAEYHNARAVGITVSVSSHVPKPHTPFQWCAMDTVEEIERKQDRLHRSARRHRLEFRRHDPRVSYLECILGRGDRRVADLIETAWRNGARFDSWGDQFRWELWVDAMRAHADLPYDLFLGTLPTDARLPWDHLDMQLTDRFLLTEYRRSMKGKLSPPCGKPVGAQVHHTNLAEHENDRRILVCYHCGVECDMTAMREERGTFLEKLGALQPAASAPPPLPAPASTPAKYRIVYAKTGVAALTGHLDLVRVLPRVLRRAGLQAHYSEGFHPKPVMEFAPPLPLGVTGLQEAVDLSLDDAIEPGELLARLRRNAPPGLFFRTVTRLPEGARKLSRELTGAEYLVRVDPEHLAGLPHGARQLDELPARFLARTEATWEVLRKRKPKTVDLRPAVEHVEWVDRRDVPEELASWRDTAARVLAVRVKLEGDAHARPEEVAAAMLGQDPGFEAPHLARVRLVLRGSDAVPEELLAT